MDFAFVTVPALPASLASKSASNFLAASRLPAQQRTVASRAAALPNHTMTASAAPSAPPATAELDKLRFLTPALASEIRDRFGSPSYVYSLDLLGENADAALAFPNAFGLTARFAMKALPNAAVLRYLTKKGMHIDASSVHEAWRAMKAGVPPGNITLSTQDFGAEGEVQAVVAAGVGVNVCSLEQLEIYGRSFPGTKVGVRFNPGLGSGGTSKTNVGGAGSSFGIWHEWLPQVTEIAARHSIEITRVHTHIGSGSDPKVWQKVAGLSLALVDAIPSVTTLNLGGGYKVARMPGEVPTDLATIGAPVADAFRDFAARTGRELRLEIEPGTFMVANVGALVCTARDVVTTGTSAGRAFVKLDSGMTEILRPSLYGALHPIVVVNGSAETQNYVVVGHCCESGDLMTPAPGEPDVISERALAKVQPGDLVVVEGVGAYCASMSAKNYNSFPEAAEVLVDHRGEAHLIRKKQTLDQILENEIQVAEAVLE